MELIFYDFEVFKHDWLVVFRSQERETIIVNRQDELEAFYQENKNNVFVGYNSRSYDQYIFKGILAGFNPKEINDFIIVQGKKGWEFSDVFNRIQLYNYDCMPSRYHSLKELEGFFGSDIKESDVDFNIDRKLTNEEIKYISDRKRGEGIYVFGASRTIKKQTIVPFENEFKKSNYIYRIINTSYDAE